MALALFPWSVKETQTPSCWNAVIWYLYDVFDAVSKIARTISISIDWMSVAKRLPAHRALA
jgi:hypothetical protein